MRGRNSAMKHLILYKFKFSRAVGLTCYIDTFPDNEIYDVMFQSKSLFCSFLQVQLTQVLHYFLSSFSFIISHTHLYIKRKRKPRSSKNKKIVNAYEIPVKASLLTLWHFRI